MTHGKASTTIRFGAHDFLRAIRVARRHLQPLQIFERVVQERTKVLGSAIKALGFAVAGALWLASAKDDLTVKLSIFDLTIPAAYVNVAVALSFDGFMLGMISYFVLNECARIVADRLLEFDSAWALSTLYDGGSAWSLVLTQQFRYFQSNAHNRLGNAFAVHSLVPFIFLVGFVIYTVAHVGFNVLAANGMMSLNGMLTVLACAFVVLPFAVIALMLTPFKFKKNVNFIRWRLLAMYRRTGELPPRVYSWVPQTNPSAKQRGN